MRLTLLQRTNKHVRKGENCNLKYFPYTLVEDEKALRSYHGVLLTKLFAQSGGFRRF